MSVEIVRDYFKKNNIHKEILEFPVSSATVELAAQAVGVEPARIAKTLSFYTKEKDAAILIVTAGDMKIDNSKFKQFFGPESITVYLDVSMKRFETVFPAAGSGNSAVELTCGELEQYTCAKEWIDVCKPMS